MFLLTFDVIKGNHAVYPPFLLFLHESVICINASVLFDVWKLICCLVKFPGILSSLWNRFFPSVESRGIGISFKLSIWKKCLHYYSRSLVSNQTYTAWFCTQLCQTHVEIENWRLLSYIWSTNLKITETHVR